MKVDDKKIDRLSVYVLFGIGFVAVIGGLIQVRSHLFYTDREVIAPFTEELLAARENAPEETVADIIGSGSRAADDLALLEQTDTDGDGLNDFYETYVSATSPFLSDSDSDGIIDPDELASGSDPNCAEGTGCDAERTGGSGTSTVAASEFTELNPTLAQNESTQELLNLEPDEIRRLLLESGVSEDVLSQATDEQLLQLAEETALETGGTTADATQNILGQAESLRNLSAAEKRSLLLQNGVTQDEVDSLSDEELDELFDIAIDQSVADLSTGGAVTGTDNN